MLERLFRKRRRRGAIGTGRTRCKLAELLTKELGYAVYPECIWDQNHNEFYRLTDCARWGWKARRPEEPFDTLGASWATMGQCVKQGIILSEEDGTVIASPKEYFMPEVYERIYHHQFAERAAAPIEVELGKSVRKVFTLTGRLRVTVYAAGRSRAWASFGVEEQAHLYVKDGETMRILGPFVEEDHLGIQWRAADYTEKITLHEADLLHHAVWLAHGELSGDAAVEALWSLLWSALTDSKEFRDSLAQYWPKWIQGLGLEEKPAATARAEKE